METVNYRIRARDVGDDGVTFDVSPTYNYLIQDALEAEMNRRGIKARLEPDTINYRSVRVVFETSQTEDTVVDLIKALTSKDITKDINLELAGKVLMDTLERYVGANAYAMVGLDEIHNQLVLYTQTRSQGNRIVSFMGHTFHGYNIIVKTFGKVRLLGRTRV